MAIPIKSASDWHEFSEEINDVMLNFRMWRYSVLCFHALLLAVLITLCVAKRDPQLPASFWAQFTQPRIARRYINDDNMYRNVMNYQQRMDELDGTLGLQRYYQNYVH
ncbi:unnamed protein product [Gongylonema pulchrum]|uniref:Transmembrane protein 188 n=1 Tax=Gongylonema pulchrum TaxID=637853 RepID=A0A183D2G8_9BILA|nr:unnamed protein product [Gongylonema pulchrum]